MNAAHYPLRRTRLVVLHKAVVDAQLGIGVLPIGLDEESTIVAVHRGLNQDRPLEVGGEPLHVRRAPAASGRVRLTKKASSATSRRMIAPSRSITAMSRACGVESIGSPIDTTSQGGTRPRIKK